MTEQRTIDPKLSESLTCPECGWLVGHNIACKYEVRQDRNQWKATALSCAANVAKLQNALAEVLEENDLTCMRASEEIPAGECPCTNCVAGRLL